MANNIFQKLLDYAQQHSQQEIIEHLQQLAQGTAQDESAEPDIRPVGHRPYDQFMDELSNAVLTAEPKEVFIEKFLDRIDTRQKPASFAGCFFVLEVTRNTAGKITRVNGLAQRRVKQQAWDNWCNDPATLAKLTGSTLLARVVAEGQPVELESTGYMPDYQGEFDTLARTTIGQPAMHNGFWLTLIILPGYTQTEPCQLLIALYPNKGDLFRPISPSSAIQESRVLRHFALTYRLLSHQLLAGAEQIFQRRSELLNSLAPGILHHEIGNAIQLINENADLQLELAFRLWEQLQDTPDAELLIESMELQQQHAQRLYGILDAFNNLERRSAAEPFTLSDVVGQSFDLAATRLGSVGIYADFPDPDADPSTNLEMVSDPALLLHLLINLFMNAANAVEEAEQTAEHNGGYQLHMRWSICTDTEEKAETGDSEKIEIIICNQGPTIDEGHLERIFERGFTTRKKGHGQGLYICRLIATYLGGTLVAMRQDEMPSPCQVGFRLVVARELPQHQDLDTLRQQVQGGAY